MEVYTGVIKFEHHCCCPYTETIVCGVYSSYNLAEEECDKYITSRGYKKDEPYNCYMNGADKATFNISHCIVDKKRGE